MENRDFIKDELRSGENVLWRGEPELTGKGVRYRGTAVTTVFGIFFTAFAVFWIAMAAQTAPFFALFGLIFVGAGLYMIFGMNLLRRKSLKRTQYAVTDRRLIIVRDGQIKTMNLEDIPMVEKQYYDDGNGTLRFERINSGFTSYYNRQAEMSPMLRYVPFAFENIREPAEVSRIIDDAKQALRQA